MLAYQCSESKLADAILDQVSFRLGNLFPRQKDWQASIRFFEGAAHARRILMVEVFDLEQRLIFACLGKGVDRAHLGLGAEVNQWLKKVDPKSKEPQLIYLVAEHDEITSKSTLMAERHNANLMVLSADDLFFSLGSFANARLEYRLSKHRVDAESLPGRIDATPLYELDRSRKVQSFQALFQRIDLSWLTQEKDLSIEALVKEAGIWMGGLNKKNRTRLLKEVRQDLQSMINEFLSDFLRIEEFRKKERSHPQARLLFLQDAKDKKQRSQWARKRMQALDALRTGNETIMLDQALEAKLESTDDWD